MSLVGKFLEASLKKLVDQYKKYVVVKGDYVEKQSSFFVAS